MRRIVAIGSLSLLVVGLFIGWGSITMVGAKIATYFYGDPDLPSESESENEALNGMSKEEYLLKRAEQYAMFRGVEKDKPFDPQLRINGIKKLEEQEAKLIEMPASPKKEALMSPWATIGPNPIANVGWSGRTIAIAVHPTNPDIVYVGTAQGGLYRTTDGGTTWTALLDNALSLAIGAVAIAPSDPETVYVGTGEPQFSLDSFFGVGVYRITNASSGSPTISSALNKNTSNVDVFSGSAVARIAVDPTNADNIFVATGAGFGGVSGSFPVSTPPYGLYRSTNATGVSPTFSKLSGVGTNNFLCLTDVVLDPGNPNRLVVAAGDVFGVGGGGVYLSTNALAATPTFALTKPVAGTNRIELAINRVGAVTTVFSATGEGNGGVYRSIDGGASWTTQSNTGFCNLQCWYDIGLAVDPNDATRVYVGGSDNFGGVTFAFSTNGATSFIASQAGLHTDTQAITVAPSLPSTIYFGSDGGIWKSTNSGVSWVSLNNSTFNATQFTGLAVHPIDTNFTIGGTQDNGTNKHFPAGTWNLIAGGDGGNSVIDQNATNTTNVTMYHTFQNATTYRRSVNAGNSWVTSASCSGTPLFYGPLEQGPGNPNTVYLGTNRLCRSADTGTTQTVVSQVFGGPLSAIGISPQNDNVRIVGQQNGGIFGTTTGSTTLIDLDPANTVPNSYIARAVVDPLNADTAYVTISAFGVTNVWRTTTLSSFADTENISPTWVARVGTGANVIPQVPVNAFMVDPIDSNRLYAGTDIGVYYSFDAGANWYPFGTGLPRVAVFDIAMAPGRIVRIATHGRGMWQIPAGPTAATVSVSGRVLTSDGRGITNATVVMADSTGNTRSVRTSSFGYYRFDDLVSGETYVVSVASKRFQFSPRTVTINDELSDFDLVADGPSDLRK